MSDEIKKIIEESTTKAERLEKLDGLNHRLNDDELEAVTGGGWELPDCPGGIPDPNKCGNCVMYSSISNKCLKNGRSSLNGCTGGMPDPRDCSGCPNLQHIGPRKDKCTLSGEETGL